MNSNQSTNARFFTITFFCNYIISGWNELYLPLSEPDEVTRGDLNPTKLNYVFKFWSAAQDGEAYAFDTNTVTGCLIMTSLLVSVILLAVDILYAYVDPRIKAQYSK